MMIIFLELPVVHSLIDFKSQSDLIVANRLTEELTDNIEKVFTRDLYGIN